MSSGPIQPIYKSAILVVAKCPRVGTSKTRLAKLVGDQGSCKLAEALLSDTLVSISHDTNLRCDLKILLYAPGDPSGHSQMISLLQKLNLGFFDAMSPTIIFDSVPSSWYLLPAPKRDSETSTSLIQSDLGYLLAHGLETARELLAHINMIQHCKIGSVCFLGMDSPELRLEEVKYALSLCSREDRRAYMCPAEDGGYGLLCLPSAAPPCIFTSGVDWSHPLTALSQAKALTDCRIDITFGMLMQDVDCPEDVMALISRLLRRHGDDGTFQGRVLHEFHSKESIDLRMMKRCTCPFTLAVLIELGLIQS